MTQNNKIYEKIHKKITIFINKVKYYDIVFTTNFRRFLFQRDRKKNLDNFRKFREKSLRTTIIIIIIKKKRFEKRRKDLLIMQLAIHSNC